MNAKRIWLAGLCATLLAFGNAHGQGPASTYSQTATADPTVARPESMAPTFGPPGQMSSWLVYPRADDCCGDVGANGPIGSELYLRSGVVFNAREDGLSSALDNGWAIQGGWKSYFFNPEQDRAWFVDLGILNINYDANDSGSKFRLLNVRTNVDTPFGSRVSVVPQADVNIFKLNQTFVTCGIGREWWLSGSADLCADHVNWRVGIDGGGRYGSAKLETTQFRNRTDVIGSLYIAAHSDVEIPHGHYMVILGLRAEYSYTWSDILQVQNFSDLQQFLLMANCGIRF